MAERQSIVELVLRAVDQGASAAVNGLRKALGDVGGVAANAEKATQTAAKSTGAAVKNAANEAANVAKTAAKQTGDAVEQAANKAGKAVDEAGKKAQNMGRQIAAAAAAIGAAAFFKSSVMEFAGFDDAMLKVQALSKATGAELDSLKQKASELGASTRYSAADAAAGMGQLAAAGYDTSQILEAIAPAMYAAAAGGSDLGETADQLTNIMGAFGLEADQAGRVADVLTEGFTGAATSMSQLAMAMKPAGPMARGLGYSLEETVAALQALANAGIKGEMAGTALRGNLSKLLDQTPKAAEVMKKYGIQIKDTEGKYRKLSEIVRDFGKSGMGMDELSMIFGETATSFKVLIDQGADALDEYERKLLSSVGRAKQVSDAQESAIGGALRRLSAAFSELRNSFGEALAPAVSKIADALGALAGWFSKMPAWAKQALAVGTAFAVLAGSLGGIMTTIGIAKAGFAALGVSMAGIAPVVLGIGAAIGVAAGAWKLFSDASKSAADKHAQSAAKIAKDIEADKKRIDELRKLQETLLKTAPGTKEHTDAEQKLAQILPGVNTHIDEQGRLVATLTEKTDENNRKLEEHIALLEKRARAQTNDQLREQTMAFAKAAEEVEKQAQEMRRLHEEAANYNRELVDLNTAQMGYDPASRLADGAKKAEELNTKLEKQKTAWQELARTAAQQGMSASQFLSMLPSGGMSASARKQVADEYLAIMRQVKDAANQTGKEITADAKGNAGEQVQLSEEAVKQMTAAYKRHVEEVKRLQGEITNRQKSLTAELRDMARGGMNDADAWVDQRKAAQEYMQAARQAADEARRAQAGGDSVTATAKWKEAVQYADDAKAAYKALNHEVKIGDQVVISSQTALKGAMRGVKEAGELGIEFLKEQEKAAADAAAAMEKQVDLSKLTEGMDEAEKKWVEGWRKMRGEVEETAEQVYNVWKNAAGFWTNTNDAFSAGWSKGTEEFEREWNGAYASFERRGKAAADFVKKAIDKAAEDRQTTIRIRAIETRRWGGLIGDALGLARGGKLPGYGGGDRVSALLEAGEFVVRKEAVKRFGAGFFEALNHLRVPDLSTLMPQMPQPALATPMGHMVLELKLPGGDTVTATVSKDDAETLARHNRRVSNLRFRK